MKIILLTLHLLSHQWHGWQLVVAWTISLALLMLLAYLRMATAAEFTFASLAILPVLFIAWVGGRKCGMVIAGLATSIWLIGDITSAKHFSAEWIPWVNAAVRMMNYALVAFLATKLRQQYDKEHEYASIDPLTGIANRRNFFEIGEHEVQRARRYQHSLAVVFLDLDNFKKLNDSLGHAKGDAALLATAQTLKSALRASDHIARIGGDEFAVLLPEIEYDAAVETGRKLVNTINAAMHGFGSVSCSLGLVWTCAPEEDFSSILRAADHLMYGVKHQRSEQAHINCCKLEDLTNGTNNTGAH